MCDAVRIERAESEPSRRDEGFGRTKPLIDLASRRATSIGASNLWAGRSSNIFLRLRFVEKRGAQHSIIIGHFGTLQSLVCRHAAKLPFFGRAQTNDPPARRATRNYADGDIDCTISAAVLEHRIRTTSSVIVRLRDADIRPSGADDRVLQTGVNRHFLFYSNASCLTIR